MPVPSTLLTRLGLATFGLAFFSGHVVPFQGVGRSPIDPTWWPQRVTHKSPASHPRARVGATPDIKVVADPKDS